MRGVVVDRRGILLSLVAFQGFFWGHLSDLFLWLVARHLLITVILDDLDVVDILLWIRKFASRSVAQEVVVCECLGLAACLLVAEPP